MSRSQFSVVLLAAILAVTLAGCAAGAGVSQPVAPPRGAGRGRARPTDGHGPSGSGNLHPCNRDPRNRRACHSRSRSRLPGHAEG